MGDRIFAIESGANNVNARTLTSHIPTYSSRRKNASTSCCHASEYISSGFLWTLLYNLIKLFGADNVQQPQILHMKSREKEKMVTVANHKWTEVTPCTPESRNGKSLLTDARYNIHNGVAFISVYTRDVWNHLRLCDNDDFGFMFSVFWPASVLRAASCPC